MFQTDTPYPMTQLVYHLEFIHFAYNFKLQGHSCARNS